MAPQNIPPAISVLTLGNKVILYCTVFHMVSVDVSNIRRRRRRRSSGTAELRSCVKVEMDVLGYPSLILLYGLCGRKATLEEERPNWSLWT